MQLLGTNLCLSHNVCRGSARLPAVRTTILMSKHSFLPAVACVLTVQRVGAETPDGVTAKMTEIAGRNTIRGTGKDAETEETMMLAANKTMIDAMTSTTAGEMRSGIENDD